MKKICFLLLACLYFSYVPAICALPDAEVQKLVKTSPEFAAAEKELLDTWKNLPAELKAAIKDYHIEWIKVERDIDAADLMKAGYSYEEAYTIVTRKQTELLQQVVLELKRTNLDNKKKSAPISANKEKEEKEKNRQILAAEFFETKEPFHINTLFFNALVAAYSVDRVKTVKKLKTFSKKDLNTLYLLTLYHPLPKEEFLRSKESVELDATLGDLAGKRKYTKVEQGTMGTFLDGGSSYAVYEFIDKNGENKAVEIGPETFLDGIELPSEGQPVALFFLNDAFVGKIVGLDPKIEHHTTATKNSAVDTQMGNEIIFDSLERLPKDELARILSELTVWEKTEKNEDSEKIWKRMRDQGLYPSEKELSDRALIVKTISLGEKFGVFDDLNEEQKEGIRAFKFYCNAEFIKAYDSAASLAAKGEPFSQLIIGLILTSGIKAIKPDYALAEKYLKNVIAVNPDNIQAKIRLIVAYHEQRKKEEAITLIEELEKLKIEDHRLIEEILGAKLMIYGGEAAKNVIIAPIKEVAEKLIEKLTDEKLKKQTNPETSHKKNEAKKKLTEEKFDITIWIGIFLVLALVGWNKIENKKLVVIYLKKIFSDAAILWQHILVNTLLIMAFNAGQHDFSDGFYTVLKIVVFLATLGVMWRRFIWLRMGAGNRALFWVFAGVAIVFNPIIQVHFERETWKVFNLIAAGFFVIDGYTKLKAVRAFRWRG